MSDGLPPTVHTDLHAPALREYFLARVGQSVQDFYAGVPMSKFPEDLRVYEHLLWDAAPDTVIELGTQYGGSALWFRDRLRALVSYGRTADVRVISVDLGQTWARNSFTGLDSEGITLIEGSLADPGVVEQVERLAGERCFVVEDSAHTYETTAAALRLYARFVPVGGFMVVEDGCVDDEELRLTEEWPRGVRPAIDEWLPTPEGRAFRTRPDLELYGVTCHPGGFLQRMAPAA